MPASPSFPRLPMDWSEEFLSVQGGTIKIRVYRAAKFETGRMLFLVHGQSEQSDRYEHFPHYLKGTVEAIACVDLPGHGKSTGVRGHVENFDVYQIAVLAAFRASKAWMTAEAGKCEVHWFGHSLGGLITLRALAAEPALDIASVCVSAPLIELALPIPRVKSLFGQWIEPLWGSLKLGNELKGDMISHDPSVGTEALRNLLNHQSVTPRFFVHLMREMPLLQNYRGPFSYSILFLVPLADSIVNWKAIYQFYSNLQMKPGKSKSLTSFPNFFHESFNEVGKERAFNALSDWLIKNSKLAF